MFKNVFILGLISGLIATVACLVYSNMYFSILVDFSEAVGIVTVLSNCLMVTMIACFVYFGLTKIIQNTNIVDFIFNMLLTLGSIGTVFFILKGNDPSFVNEDAQMMVDYYKGFVMPMLFFPALAWMTFKPLIIKK